MSDDRSIQKLFTPPHDWRAWAASHANRMLPTQVIRLGQKWGNLKMCPEEFSLTAFERNHIGPYDLVLILVGLLHEVDGFYNESTRTAIAPQFTLAVPRFGEDELYLNTVLVMDIHVQFIEGRIRPRIRDVPRLLSEHVMSLHDVILSMDRFCSLVSEYCQYLSQGVPVEYLRFNSRDSTLCQLWESEAEAEEASHLHQTPDFVPQDVGVK